MSDFVPTHWPWFRAVAQQNPDILTLFDLIWEKNLSRMITLFEAERVGSIKSRTDYVARSDPEKSTSAPGNAPEMRWIPYIGYEDQTARLTGSFEYDLQVVLMKILQEEEAADWIIPESAFISRVSQEAEGLRAYYIGELQARLSRVTHIQESYWRPFIRPYGWMVVAYEALIHVWSHAIQDNMQQAATKLLSSAVGKSWWSWARAGGYAIKGLRSLMYPGKTLVNILEYCRVVGPMIAKQYAKELAVVRDIQQWFFLPPMGITPTFFAAGSLFGYALLGLMGGVVVGRLGWEALEALGVDMPSVNEDDKKKLQAQFSPEEWGLVSEEANKLGAEVTALLDQLSRYEEELTGETQVAQAVRPLSYRLEAFKNRISTFGAGAASSDVSFDFLIRPLLTRVDEMIMRAKAAQPAPLGAATLPEGYVSGDDAPQADEFIVWEIITPELSQRLLGLEEAGTELTEELVTNILNEVVEKRRPQWETALVADLMSRMTLVYGEQVDQAFVRATSAANAISDMMASAAPSSYDYIAQVTILKGAASQIPDETTLRTINDIIEVAETLIVEIKHSEDRRRVVDAGGSNEDSLERSQGGVQGGD